MAGDVSFTALVVSIATSAAVHFGDLADGESGATEPNLDAAGQMIDMLALLQDKTRGNLTAEESHFLGQVLYELRLRYVEARKASGHPSIDPAPGPRS